MDTPDEGVQDGAPGDAGQGEGQQRSVPEFVVGTYKSREEAERGLREKDETINRLRSERDRAAAHLQEQMAAALTKLADASSRRDTKPDDTAQRVEALVTDIAEAFRADEAKGARKTLEVLNAYLADVESKGSREVEKTRKELRDEMETKLAEVRTLLADRDPEYVPVKDKVAELAQELGLDARAHREVLVKLARREAKTAHPGRHELPGGVVGAGSRAADEDGPSVEELAMLEQFVGKLSDKEKAALKRRKG